MEKQNSYAGTCRTCGKPVGSLEGWVFLEGDNWNVYCVEHSGHLNDFAGLGGLRGGMRRAQDRWDRMTAAERSDYVKAHGSTPLGVHRPNLT
jgi:hypothetical protein